MPDLKHILVMSDPQFENWLGQERARQDQEWKEMFRHGVEIAFPGPDGGMAQSLASMKETIEHHRLVPDRTHLFFTEVDLRAARASYKVQQAAARHWQPGAPEDAMTHVTEERQVTRTEKVTVQVLCDCCGEPFKPDPFVTHEVCQRESYGGDGGSTEEYDVCQKCWTERIVPLFKTGPNNIEW